MITIVDVILDGSGTAQVDDVSVSPSALPHLIVWRIVDKRQGGAGPYAWNFQWTINPPNGIFSAFTPVDNTVWAVMSDTYLPSGTPHSYEYQLKITSGRKKHAVKLPKGVGAGGGGNPNIKNN